LEHALKQVDSDYQKVNLEELEIDISAAQNKRSNFPKCVKKLVMLKSLRDHIVDTFMQRRDVIRKKIELEEKKKQVELEETIRKREEADRKHLENEARNK